MIAGLIDHLWQSSLFAGAAGLLTLLLRANAARVRFWLWFAASVKFLLPFAGLAALGALLLPPPAAPLPVLEAFAPAAAPYVVPVAHVMPAISTHAVTSVASQGPAFDWTFLLCFLWAAGTLAIGFRWLARWRTMHAALKAAGSVSTIGGFAVLTASGPLEPGLFGILKPVILLPQGIGEKLSPAELQAVLAHEACHGRHRDNLWAAVHMLVEALFWFHPLVWWLGARLNQERERACDEAVLASGQEPEVYAESILKVCKLYVQSPLPCVSGISGAGLKERIERIVVNAVAPPLSLLRKSLLAGCAAVSLALPVGAGLLLAPGLVQAEPQAEPVITPERMAELRAEQSAPRKAVPFDPKNFDKFVGEYQLGPGTIAWVTRDGDHYLSRLTGQMNVEFFPESQTKFFATVVPAQISFDSDAGGRVTALVLHQAGLEQRAPRVSAETAKALEDALLSRMRANKPSPGTEAALRHQIESMETGTRDFAPLTPQMAAVARAQWPGTSQMIAGLGALKSVTFKNVAPGGADVYDVLFERGHVQWAIAPLTADGKINGMAPRMVQ